MGNYTQPNPFVPGYRLINGEKLNDAIAKDQVSSQDGITAHSGGGQANAYQLTAVISRITTVAVANDSVKLMAAVPGQSITVDNDGANTLAVYPSGTDQIEDSTSSVSILVGQDVTFVCPAQGKWYELGSSGAFSGAITVAGNITETAVGSGFVQKASATGAGRAGTFTLVGATNVTVTNTTVATSDFIGISLNTVIGTVGVQPHVVSIQAGTSFVVVGTANDSSTYNYSMIGVN